MGIIFKTGMHRPPHPLLLAVAVPSPPRCLPANSGTWSRSDAEERRSPSTRKTRTAIEPTFRGDGNNGEGTSERGDTNDRETSRREDVKVKVTLERHAMSIVVIYCFVVVNAIDIRILLIIAAAVLVLYHNINERCEARPITKRGSGF